MQMTARRREMMQSSKKANLITGAVAKVTIGGLETLYCTCECVSQSVCSRMDRGPVPHGLQRPSMGLRHLYVNRDVATVVNSQRLHMKQVY